MGELLENAVPLPPCMWVAIVFSGEGRRAEGDPRISAPRCPVCVAAAAQSATCGGADLRDTQVGV